MACRVEDEHGHVLTTSSKGSEMSDVKEKHFGVGFYGGYGGYGGYYGGYYDGWGRGGGCCPQNPCGRCSMCVVKVTRVCCEEDPCGNCSRCWVSRRSYSSCCPTDCYDECCYPRRNRCCNDDPCRCRPRRSLCTTFTGTGTFTSSTEGFETGTITTMTGTRNSDGSYTVTGTVDSGGTTATFTATMFLASKTLNGSFAANGNLLTDEGTVPFSFGGSYSILCTSGGSFPVGTGTPGGPGIEANRMFSTGRTRAVGGSSSAYRRGQSLITGARLARKNMAAAPGVPAPSLSSRQHVEVSTLSFANRKITVSTLHSTLGESQSTIVAADNENKNLTLEIAPPERCKSITVDVRSSSGTELSHSKLYMAGTSGANAPGSEGMVVSLNEEGTLVLLLNNVAGSTKEFIINLTYIL